MTRLLPLLLAPSLAFGLLACATGGDDFVRASYLEQASLRVKWHDTEAQVRAACSEGRWLGQGRP